eukprot:1966627-Pyramimonas_sp.AAC.1
MSRQAWVMRAWWFGLANQKESHSRMVCLRSSMSGSSSPRGTASVAVRHLPGALPAIAWAAWRRCWVMALGKRPMTWRP